MMFRLAALSVAAAMIAVTGFAATDAMITAPPEIIRIEVAPDQLADCERTLREVGAMPAVADDGSPLLFDGGTGMPSVVCAISIDA